MNARRQEELAGRRAQLEAAQLLAEQRAAAEREARGLTRHSSEVRLSDGDLAALAELANSSAFQPTEVRRLRALAAISPEVPPPHVQAVFDQCDIADRRARACPSWLPALCKQRAEFLGAVLQRSELDGGAAYMVMYCRQSPYFAKFLRLQPKCRTLPALAGRSANEVLDPRPASVP